MLFPLVLAASASLAGQLAASAGEPIGQEAQPSAPAVAESQREVCAVLEELIERTSSVRAFKAVYVAEGAGPQALRYEFEYLAPDLLHMLVAPEEGPLVESWIDGSKLWALGAGDPFWAELDWAESPIKRPPWFQALEARFPLSGESALYHPFLLATWNVSDKLDLVDFQFFVGSDRGPDRALLGWLRVLANDASAVRLTDDAVVQETPRSRATISREHGFLEELTIVTRNGVPSSVRLVDLELDPELDRAAFVPPARPAGIRDQSSEMARFVFPEDLFAPRATIFRRVDHLLARGAIEWDAATQDGLAEVLRSLFGPLLVALAKDRLPKAIAQQDEIFENLRDRLAQGETRENLERRIAENRAVLVQALDRALRLLQEHEAPLPLPGKCAVWDDLFLLEDGVLEELHVQHFAGPVLELYDAAAAAFLRG